MSEGAFSSRLPRLVEPARLAQQELVLQGFVPAESLPRVNAAVMKLSPVECDLAFSVDEQYRRLVTGKLRVRADLCCQRCLDAVNLCLDVEVNVALVKDESQAKNLPSWLDPWLVNEAEADLYEFVEEELLLNIPQIAWHEEDCIDPALYSSGELEEDKKEEKENPFKMLEQLKQKVKPE